MILYQQIIFVVMLERMERLLLLLEVRGLRRNELLRMY